ncbi:MAG: hypothetical protein ACRD0I_03405 [Acidimicrobiales bacterium]
MHPIELLRYVARSEGEGPSRFVPEAAGALAAVGSDPLALVPACRRLLFRHPEMGPLWWLAARMLAATNPRAEAGNCADAITDDPTPRDLARELPESARVAVLGWPELAGAGLGRRGDASVLAIDADGGAYGLSRWLGRQPCLIEEVPESGLGAAVSASDLLILEAWALGHPLAPGRDREPMGRDGEFVAISGSRAAASVARAEGIPVWLVAGVGRVLPDALWSELEWHFDQAGAPPWERGDEIVPLDLVDVVIGPGGAADPAEALGRADCPVVAELLGHFG